MVVPVENVICDAVVAARGLRLAGRPNRRSEMTRIGRDNIADVIMVIPYAIERHVELPPMMTGLALPLCDAALVTVMQPAGLRDGDDRSEGGDGPRDRGVLRQTEVGAGVLVVRLVPGEDSSQAALVEHDDVVETFAPNRANDALHVPVLPR